MVSDMSEETTLVRRNEAPLVEASPKRAPDFGDLLMLMKQENLPPDAIRELVGLAKDMEDRMAKSAFNRALIAMKADLPPIYHSRRVHFESKKPGAPPTDYSYAELHEIEGTIAPFEQRHGLAHTYRERYLEGANVEVVCIIRHVEGHSVETPWTGPVDTNVRNSMNQTQRTASASSYAKRQALIMAYGLRIVPAPKPDGTTDPIDDDGWQGELQTITAEQAADLDALIDEVGAKRPAFLAWANVDRLSDFPARRFQEAVQLLEAKRRGT